MRRLNSVDLPTFGRPTIAIRGSEDDMRCSDGNSLPFWKIAHQKIVDLRCLLMIYSRGSEIDRVLKINDRKRSGSDQVAPPVPSDFLFWGGPETVYRSNSDGRLDDKSVGGTGRL